MTSEFFQKEVELIQVIWSVLLFHFISCSDGLPVRIQVVKPTPQSVDHMPNVLTITPPSIINAS